MTSPPPPDPVGKDIRHLVLPPNPPGSPAMTDEPPPKRYKFVNSITVLAGSEEQAFQLDVDEACAKSTFFKSACSEKWKEGKDKVIKVPSIAPATMENYIKWVYKDKLPDEALSTPGSTLIDEDANFAYEEHVELYIAAQFLGDDTLQILTIDFLRQTHPCGGEDSSTQLVHTVWESTSTACGLQRLLVDTLLTYARPRLVHEWLGAQPFNFVHAVGVRTIMELGKDKETFDPRENDKCYYHDHKEGEKCESSSAKKKKARGWGTCA